jgi:putative transposase
MEFWRTTGPRIHGELQNLGLEVSERTVSRLMPRRREAPSQSWRTIFDNHLGAIIAIDFFTVPTASFRVLFVMVVLAHHRRRIVHFNVTANPTVVWTAQQAVEAFPEESAPRFLIRDRDQIYGEEFCQRVKGMGIEEVITAARSPWQNPFVERVIGSLRRECLDHVTVTRPPIAPIMRSTARSVDGSEGLSRDASHYSVFRLIEEDD